MVTPPRGRHRNELAKCPKRNQPKKRYGHPTVKQHGDGQHQADSQPGENPVVKGANNGWIDVRFWPSLEDLAYHREYSQHTQQTDQQDYRPVIAQQGLWSIV